MRITRIPTLLTLTLTLTLGVGLSAARATEDRSAETILKEYDAITMPKLDPAKRDAESIRALRKAMAEAQTQKADLALELFRAHPDNERVPALLMSRWLVFMLDPTTAGRTVTEIDEAMPRFKEPKQAREAAYLRAIATIRSNEPTPEAAIPTIDAYIHGDPKDPRGAMLLNGLASQADDPALKSKLMQRVIDEFPGTAAARSAEGQLHMREKIGKPLELAFDEAVKGSPISIKGLKGKVVVLDFWATWCGPCVAEMPKMKELYARYHDQGVEFIGVSLDQPKEQGGLDKLKAFVAEHEIAWPQYYQGDGWNSEFSGGLGIDSIPRVFLIDAEGNLAEVDARGKLDTLIPKYLARAHASTGAERP